MNGAIPRPRTRGSFVLPCHVPYPAIDTLSARLAVWREDVPEEYLGADDDDVRPCVHVFCFVSEFMGLHTHTPTHAIRLQSLSDKCIELVIWDITWVPR